MAIIRASDQVTAPGEIRAAVGRRIKEAREALGWTQSAFARRLGVDPRTVQRWEQGGPMPRLEHLVELADLLEIPRDELLPARNGDLPLRSEIAELRERVEKLEGRMGDV